MPVALLFVFYVLPIMWAFRLSFADYHPVYGTTWTGLDNFKRMLEDSIFWLALRNTIVYTALTVFIGLGISLVLSAIIFNFKRRTIQTFFKGSLYLPAVASGVALSMVWLWLFQPTFGMFNYLLSLVGIPPQLWLADPDIVMPSLIFMALAIERGAQIILLTASMGSIPDSLYEAAKIDGAGRFREFLSITVPLLRPTILYLVVIGVIHAMQVFTQIFIMTNGGPGHASRTVVFHIFRIAFDNFDFGLASVQSLVLFFILAVAALITYRALGTQVEY